MRRRLSILSLLLALGVVHRAQAADQTVPAGTTLNVRTLDAVDSNRMGSGAKFRVALESSLKVGDTVVAPDGSTAYGVLVDRKRDKNLVGKSEMTIALTGIKIDGAMVPITTSGVKAVQSGKGRATARKAAAGAVIGAVFGGGKGAAMGAGAAVGAQLLLGGKQVSIPSNTLLEFTLAKPVVVAGKAAEAPKPAASGGAMDPTALALSVAKARGANAEALADYGWHQRTELRYAGAPLLVRLEMLRFDFDGNLQRTKMSEEPSKAGAKEAYLDEVYGLRSYALPSPGELVDFFQKAKIEQSGDTIVASGKNVLEKGDAVKLSIDAETSEIRAIEVSGKVGGDAFSAKIDYRDIGDSGPNGPARALVQIPAQKLEIQIENFSYQKQ